MADQVMRMPKPGSADDAGTSNNTRQLLSRQAATPASALQHVPPAVHDVLRTPGTPLDRATRDFFEPRFGQDFSHVRTHTDFNAENSASQISARAYTVGSDIVFGTGEYAPHSGEGRRLLAHELTHVVQQGREQQAQTAVPGGMKEPNTAVSHQVAEPILSRTPIYPDTTCDTVQDSITRAWPTARRWVQTAISRLNDATGVAGALQTHFKIDPNDSTHAADLATVRENFARMLELFDTDIDNRCTSANSGEQCTLPDGRIYAAFVHSGRPGDGITHCLQSADVGFLSQESLIETLVHEVAHLADSASTDFSYRHQAVITTYANMTRSQAIHNGDSYSGFARDQFVGTATSSLLLGLTTGVLLSSGRPRWAIGASYDIRSRSGIAVFDLVGGLHAFIALDVGAPAGEPVLREFGSELNVGVISRSAETRFFADTRLGGFATLDVAGREPARVGLSSSTVIGWADSGFRAGVNLRLLYDFLQGNHAVIIGGEFNWGP